MLPILNCHRPHSWAALFSELTEVDEIFFIVEGRVGMAGKSAEEKVEIQREAGIGIIMRPSEFGTQLKRLCSGYRFIHLH